MWHITQTDQTCGTGFSDDGGDLNKQNDATKGGQISLTGTGNMQSPQSRLDDLVFALLRSRDGDPPQSNQILTLTAFCSCKMHNLRSIIEHPHPSLSCPQHLHHRVASISDFNHPKER